MHHSTSSKGTRLTAKLKTAFSSRNASRLICALLSLLILGQQQLLASVSNPSDATPSEALQAADVLQVRPQVERLLQLNEQGARNSKDLLALRALILRKIFLGALDVRRASNRVDFELSYTYAVMQREQARHSNVNNFLNQLTFAQFATLYTLEPYSRQKDQFKQSAVMTCVGAGLGITLNVAGVLYNKYSKAHHTAPPTFLEHFLDGGPVDASQLPPLVERFLQTPKPGSQVSRKEEMFAAWKTQYKVDATKPGSLCSLQGDSGKSMGMLNTRIVLLWSLNTYVEDFDRELLALARMVQSPGQTPSSTDGSTLASLGLKPMALEAAQLLKIQPTVAALIQENKAGGNSDRRTELEISVLESVINGMLDLRVATDKIDGELHYAYDIVLAQLLGRRGHGLQLNYEANFIQTGVFGGIAGLLFLKKQAKAGNEMFLIQSCIGAGLSTLALWQMRGGSRKIDTPPNSLAQFLNPDQANQYHFSPLISNFLDTSAPGSTSGQTRRQFIVSQWKQRRVATINLDDTKNQLKLAALSQDVPDTIKIVRNRIELMHSLKARLEELDSDFLALIEATEPVEKQGDVISGSLNPSATAMAGLLGMAVDGGPAQTSANEVLNQQLFITRKVLRAALDAAKTVDQLDLQIAVETTARDRILRQRDLAVNLTNNANFFQIAILGIIADGPLALSKNTRLKEGNAKVNIISGYMVGGLAAATILERRAGIRMTKATTNTLASAFGIETTSDCQLSPTLMKFLNSVPPQTPNGLSRKALLMKYWQTTKVVSVNVSKRSTQEKLAASGPAHHHLAETAKLITNRIRMLFDVRGVVELMDVGLSDLLRAVDS